MVLFVRRYEWEVKELKQRRRVGSTHLRSLAWQSCPEVVVGFSSRPPEPLSTSVKLLYIDIRFAANAARVIHYFYIYTFSPFSLKIVDSRNPKHNYKYESWLVSFRNPKSGFIDRIFEPGNYYEDTISPKAIKSVFTIVPTQMSTLI